MSLSDKIIFGGLSETKVINWKEVDYAIVQRKDLKQSLKNFEAKLRKLGVKVNKDGLKLVGVELAIYELKSEFGEKLI